MDKDSPVKSKGTEYLLGRIQSGYARHLPIWEVEGYASELPRSLIKKESHAFAHRSIKTLQ